MRNILALAITLFASTAMAQQAPHRFRSSGTLLATTALSTGPTFTIENPGAGYAVANLTMIRTRNAGTDMTMTCTHTNDGGTTNPKVQVCSWSGGTCTHADVTWKTSTSTTETLAWQVDILGWISTTCTLASTSSNSSDTIKVLGAVVTQ